MGFLGLFSRKFTALTARPTDEPLRALAYDSTIPSLPPIKGTYPVAGNGPNLLEALQNSNLRHLSKTPSSEAAAPAPLVPRIREQSLESARPDTAPSSDILSSQAPKAPTCLRKDSAKALPLVSHRKSRAEHSDGSFRSSIFVRPSDLASSCSLPKPVPAFAKDRSSSLRNIDGNSVKAAVDLLDAQSAIRPSDFHDRLRATGARSYGEDVADRNIGENGSDLTSPEVRAFYATSISNRSGPMDESVAAPSISRSSRHEQEDAADILRKRHSLASRLETRSTTSSFYNDLPEGLSSYLSFQNAIETSEESSRDVSMSPQTPLDRVPCRLSVQSSISSPSSVPRKPIRQSGALKPRPLKETEVSFSTDRTPSKRRSLFKDSRNGSARTPPERTPSRQSLPPRQPRETVLLAKKTTTTIDDRQPQTQIDPSLHEEKHKSSRSHSRKGSVTYSAFPTPSKTPMQTLSLQSIRRSQPSGEDYANVANSARPRASKNEGRLVSRSHAGVGSRDEPESYTRTRSLISSPAAPHRIEFEENIPERSSSLRNWSMTSITPTSSSHSSNPFPRPQSRHTASTSLGSAARSIKRTSSHDSLTSVDRKPAGRFNLDDYISTDDDDSFIADTPRRLRCEGEEELLFRDGCYGGQLPGLPGLYMGEAPLMRIMSAHSTGSDYHTRPSSRKSLGSYHYDFGFTASPHRSRSFAEVHCLEDEYSDDDMNFDIPSSRRGLSRPQTRSIPYVNDVIEEEQDLDKYDFSRAVRLRKETRARKRANGEIARRTKGKGREKSSPKNDVETEEDGHADVESIKD